MMAWHAQLIFSLIVFKWLSYEYIWLPHSNMLPCYFEYAPSNMKSSAKTSTSKLHTFFFNCEPDRLCSILDTIQPIFPLRFVFEGKKMTLMLSNFLSHFIRLSIQRESMLPKMKNCPIDWPSSARHEYSTFSAHFDDKYPFNEYTPILCVRIFFVLFRCLML